MYQFLLDFDTLYERKTDLEKKQFMRTFIESIELYPEKKDNGRIISKIELRFSVYYDGQEGNEIRMPDKNTVETVCFPREMSRAKRSVWSSVWRTWTRTDSRRVQHITPYGTG